MMVSTRSIRYKFTEGERVLCYEPDPTKAKVLYDSKVLEVIENKDKRGRRSIEYLIHFQGWNSSWDRCVSEDFVLKDTEENRQLQRDLAEKSQLQLGAYLYRRERKKGGSTTTSTGNVKRVRQGFSDDGSSTSTQPDEGEIGDTESSSGEGSGSRPRSPPLAIQLGRTITLPSALRDRLTFDYHLVVKRGRLSQLPATPSAAHILESFVKWFARAGAWHPTRGRHDPPHRPDLLDVSCRLNLVREVADGLRVYFDFVLRGHLLYKQEHGQYHEVCGQFIEDKDKEDEEHVKTETSDVMNNQCPDEQTLGVAEENLKSPKLPEYSHLPPDPVDSQSKREGASPQVDNNEEALKSETNEKAVVNKSEPQPEDSQPPNVPGGSGKTRDVRSATRSGHVARSGINGILASDVVSSIIEVSSNNRRARLRSHKSAVSQSENEEPAPSTSMGDPRTFETLSSSVGSSGSSLSESWARPAQSTAATPTATRTPLSLLLDKVTKWQIIPSQGTERLPCRVYGAVHLARLFVKLPDFLNATQMPDFKLKLILKHIDMFVQYLDEHSEWFGEMYYVADNTSRSH